jgi:hypothetical protein
MFRFEIDALGHNFYIKTVNSTGTSNQVLGVVNNGTANGIIDWTVPTVSSSTNFYYNCQFHSSMSGTISANALSTIDSTRPLFNASSFSVVPQPYLNYVNQAIQRWSNYIKFNSSIYDAIKQNYINNGYGIFNGINLEANSSPWNDPNGGLYLYNDPADNTIAYCGVTYFWNIAQSNDLKMNTDTMFLGINERWKNILSEQEWVDVLAHELGHGLGIGQFWSSAYSSSGAVPPTNFFLSGNSYTSCRDGYKKLINNGANYSLIPLEDQGSSGTASAHFENTFRSSSYPNGGGLSYPGLQNELMLGSLVDGGIMRISALSIGALIDFGYEEVNPGNNEGHIHLNSGGGLLTKTASGSTIKRIKLENCCDSEHVASSRGVIKL